MKTFFCSAAAMAFTMSGVWAQTASPPSVPAQGDAVPAVSSGGGKRAACQAAAQGVKGQQRHDQIQLCIAQARLDCLKQAIDQKVVGSQRRDFVRSCVGIDITPDRSDTADE